MLNVNELVGFGAGGGDSHKHWRIVCLTGVHANNIGSVEIAMRASIGGPNQTTGGVASSNRSFNTAGQSHDKAFDNLGNDWLAVGGSAGAWIAYEFPAPVEVKQIILLKGIINAYYFTSARIEYSDNGADWFQAAQFNTITWNTSANPLLGTSTHWADLNWP